MVKIEKASADVPSSNLLIYADSGAGKTVFAGSDDRVLFIAPEDTGLMSSVRMGSKADKIKVREWPDLVAAYEYLQANEELLENYDWLAIDSVTEMQSMLLRHLVNSQATERKSRDQDPDVPQIQDYQKLYILIERFVLAFNDLPINTIYTSLVRNVEDPDGNEFLMPMLGSNKPTDYRIAMKIASHMTSFGYFKVEVVDKPAPTEDDPKKTKKVKQRVVYWEDTGAYRGKDRTLRLAPKTVLPSRNALKSIRELIDGTTPSQPVKKVVAKKVAVKAVSEAVPFKKDVHEALPDKEADAEPDMELEDVQA